MKTKLIITLSTLLLFLFFSSCSSLKKTDKNVPPCSYSWSNIESQFNLKFSNCFKKEQRNIDCFCFDSTSFSNPIGDIIDLISVDTLITTSLFSQQLGPNEPAESEAKYLISSIKDSSQLRLHFTAKSVFEYFTIKEFQFALHSRTISDSIIDELVNLSINTTGLYSIIISYINEQLSMKTLSTRNNETWCTSLVIISDGSIETSEMIVPIDYYPANAEMMKRIH